MGKVNFLLGDIENSIPEVKNEAFYATGYELPWGHAETFQVGDKIVKLEGSRANEDFLQMFNYKLIAGNAASALKNITSIAISKKMAEMFFGSADKAMGKTLRYENHIDFMVTAVFENVTAKSSLKFDFLLNWEAQIKLLEWSSNDFQTYLRLADNADAKSVEAKLNRLLQTRLPANPGLKTQVFLQPFGDRYLQDIFVNGKPTSGRIEYIRTFSGVAIFILIIACINFMNLATARCSKTGKGNRFEKSYCAPRARN